MYIPDVFLGEAEHMSDLLRDHPLATLVLHGSADPHIAHVPLVARRDRKALLGHVARSNPLASAIRVGARATAVVHGPDAYVSPTAYVTQQGHVPTWNYAVAHVVGTLRVLEDAISVLDELVATFENDDGYRPDWTDARISELASHITCFEFVIEAIEVKLKLSQNRHADDFEAATARFERDGRRELVRWMRIANPK